MPDSMSRARLANGGRGEVDAPPGKFESATRRSPLRIDPETTARVRAALGPTPLPRLAPGGPSGPGDGLVQIAYCHTSRVSHSWHTSMMDMMVWDKTEGPNVIGSAPIRVACSGPFGLIEGRNTAVSMFLAGPHEWLFWVDTDMGFQPDSLQRLLAAATECTDPREPDGCPWEDHHHEPLKVIGGLCFAAQQLGPDGFGGVKIAPRPTLFGWVGGRGFVSKSRYPEDGVIRVAGTGSAFILIHRSVLEDMQAKHGPVWYDPVTPKGGRPISEDLSFCWRAAEMLVPVYVHTGVKTTHHKEIWVSDEMYEQPDTDPIFE